MDFGLQSTICTPTVTNNLSFVLTSEACGPCNTNVLTFNLENNHLSCYPPCLHSIDLVYGGGTGYAYWDNTTSTWSFNSITSGVTSITAGTGISIGGTATVPIITNTAPDQTVTLSNGTGITISGTYPNFTITNTAPSITSGTVTSVAASITGNSLGVTGSPIITSGTLAFAFAGTNLQYVNGEGNLTTFPLLTGYVPYTGATQDVDLGAFKLNAQSLHAKGTGGLGHLGLKHQSASATASVNEVSLFADSLGDLSWQNGNLYLSKFITSSNTAARSYTFPNVAGTVTLGTGTANNITKWTNANTVTNASSTDDGTTLTDTIKTVNSFTSATAAPAFRFTGGWFAGANSAHLLVEQATATAFAGSTNGTGLGINAVSGSLSSLADFQRAGVTLWKTGQNATNDTLTTQTGINSATATNFYLFTGMSNSTDFYIGSTRNGTYPAAASYSSIINENGGSGIRITPFNNTRLTITGDLAITNNSKFFKTSTNGVKYLGAGIERASNAEVPLSFGTTNLTIGSTEFCWAYNMPLTLAATSTTGYGMLLQHTITTGANSQTAYGLYLNQTFSTAHTGTIFSRLKLAAGSATVAPLEWTSGAVLTTARAGVMEFLTDSWYGTTTTGAIRRMFVAGNTGRATGQTSANTSVATYTLNNVADATYEVSANVLVTTSSAEFFTVTCTYTDEGNTSRTVTLNFSLVAGTIGTTIAAANGAVPYQGVPLHIRCIKNTTITIKTTGTFTGCTYNVEGVIKQTA